MLANNENNSNLDLNVLNDYSFININKLNNKRENIIIISNRNFDLNKNGIPGTSRVSFTPIVEIPDGTVMKFSVVNNINNVGVSKLYTNKDSISNRSYLFESESQVKTIKAEEYEKFI